MLPSSGCCWYIHIFVSTIFSFPPAFAVLVQDLMVNNKICQNKLICGPCCCCMSNTTSVIWSYLSWYLKTGFCFYEDSLVAVRSTVTLYHCLIEWMLSCTHFYIKNLLFLLYMFLVHLHNLSITLRAQSLLGAVCTTSSLRCLVIQYWYLHWVATICSNIECGVHGIS